MGTERSGIVYGQIPTVHVFYSYGPFYCKKKEKKKFLGGLFAITSVLYCKFAKHFTHASIDIGKIWFGVGKPGIFQWYIIVFSL